MESNCHSLDIHIHHLHQLRWERRTAVENDIWVGSRGGNRPDRAGLCLNRAGLVEKTKA